MWRLRGGGVEAGEEEDGVWDLGEGWEGGVA